MKKGIFAFVLALTMAFSSVTMAADEITVNVNGTNVVMDQSPIIENGRTLVPLRAVAEALGCSVVWDANTKTASFSMGDVMAIVTVGNDYIVVGDGVYNENVPVDSPAVIVNSRTMIPLRALSEGFGYNVEWDAATRTVNISSKDMSAGDTDSAEEQTLSDSGMAAKVDAYAQILKGTVSIIDATGFTSDEYSALKADIDSIANGITGMSDGELTDALNTLRDIDASLVNIANEAGAGDIVTNYYAQIEKPLNEVRS